MILRTKKKAEAVLFQALAYSSWIAPSNRISGCATYNTRNLAELKVPMRAKKPLQKCYDEFFSNLNARLSASTPAAVIRLGDGEAYFLCGGRFGNIVRRHLTVESPDIPPTREWIDSLSENSDLYFDINWSLRKLWRPIFGNSVKDHFKPLDVIYASVATRDIFRRLKNLTIGVIGADEKIEYIEVLTRCSEYLDYLGLQKKFKSLLPVPQIGACNDVQKLESSLRSDVLKNPCDVYLVGMGISKIWILPRLAERTGKLFIDIGSGIDAIAGLIPHDKPWFGSWVNFRVNKFPENETDFLVPKNKFLYRFNTPEDVYLPHC